MKHLFASIVAATAIASAASAAGLTPPVVVLANANDPQSLAVAEHYLESRAIPKERLIALPLPADEEIDRGTYVTRLHNPLMADLVKRGLLTGELSDVADAEGRTRLTVRAKAFEHLVVCKGVPLKIRHDAARFEAREKTLPLPPVLRVNHASVDSELALLPRPGTPLAGFVPNPRYNIVAPAAALTLDTLMVARLDGPSYDDAARLVDSALEAERTGLIGRGYVDIGGPHRAGDEKLTMTANLLRQVFFDTDVETTPALFARGCRMDAPAFYFGWYADSISGAIADPGFKFRPGAVALHIHSYSAATLRSRDAGWVGPMVARGATLTAGNVYEPYLEFTHNPALLLHGLISGMNAGEAAAYANPALSWQGVVVGDPLYRPFVHDMDRQLKDAAEHPAAEHAYALARIAAKLDADGKSDAADAILAATAPRLPVLAFACARVERDMRRGKRPVFRAADLAPVPEDAGLVYAAAEKLAQAGLSAEALALLANQHALGVKFDARAAAFARAYGKQELARKLAPR